MRPTDAFPHPSDWSVVTVRQAVEIRRGVSWSKEQEHPEPKAGAVAVLRISNVQDRLDLSDTLYLTGIPEKAKAQKKAGKAWTILVGSNGNRNRIGNAVHIEKDTDFLFASFLIGAKPYDESEIQPDFFFRWLSTHEVQYRLSASSEGSTGLSNLSHDFFRAMEIAFPDREEQKAIVRILDAVDAAIERTRTAIEKAQRLKQALLRESYESLHAPTARLGKYITDVRYGTSQASNDKGWGYPTLRIPNIVGGTIDTADLTYVEAQASDRERYALATGDLLLVRTNGNPNYIGRSAVFVQPDERLWLYASYLIRVRFDDRILPRYVDEYLKTTRGRQELLRRVTTSAGNHNINAKNIQSIPIAVPDIRAQKRIVDLADASDIHLDFCTLTTDTPNRLSRVFPTPPV